jgi:SAM-dependent methyltransferase
MRQPGRFPMQPAEFDRFADEYRALHASNIRLSGEAPEFFAAYKIRDVAEVVRDGREVSPRILDFGAGVGNSVPYFGAEFASPRLVCVDVSHRSLLVGRQRFLEQAAFVQFDGHRLPFADGAFDVVFAGCVFHHIPHDEHVPILRELRRVLRPAGLLFVFEHNPRNPLTVHAVRTCPFDENARLISGPAMRRRLRDAGLTDVVLRYRIFFPGPLSGLRPLERYLTRVGLGAQYYVLGRKAPAAA